MQLYIHIHLHKRLQGITKKWMVFIFGYKIPSDFYSYSF